MRVFVLLSSLLCVSALRASSSETRHASAPQPALRFMRKDPTRYYNPLIARRQVQAGDLRPGPARRVKRSCPSLLPNGNCACPDALTYCPDQDLCIDTSSDDNNCGACDSPCTSPFVCIDGSCQCPAGTYECYGQDGCHDFSSDPINCGQCWFGCAPGICIDGTCGCEPGYTENTNCGFCVDFNTDNTACGGCYNYCPGGTPCVGGVCVGCPSPTVLCNDACVDPTTDYEDDPANCGGCGQSCGFNQLCSGGNCYCPSGYTFCGPEDYGSCVAGSTCAFGNQMIGLADASNPNVIVCWLYGQGCGSLELTGEGTWSGTVGTYVSLRGYTASGTFMGLAAAVFGIPTHAENNLGVLRVSTSFSEVSPSSTARYDSSSGEYYETDVWSYLPGAYNPVFIHGVQGSPDLQGNGQQISAVWQDQANYADEVGLTFVFGGGQLYMSGYTEAINTGYPQVYMYVVSDLVPEQ